MQRLSNDQLAEKMRAANRRRSERQRAKRVEAGRAALTVWIPANLQKQIVELAAAEQATTSEIATRLLQAALEPATLVEASPEPEPAHLVAEPATKPAKVDKATPDYSERDRLIMQFRGEGLGYDAISKRLADVGIIAGTGNPVSKTTVKKVLKDAGLLAD